MADLNKRIWVRSRDDVRGTEVEKEIGCVPDVPTNILIIMFEATEPESETM